MDYISYYESPLGGITMASNGSALTGLWFDGQKHFGSTAGEHRETAELPVFVQTKKWLDVYFSGNEPDFMPPVKMDGTPFRKEVWEILMKIPYGETMTYGQIAEQIAISRGLERMSAQAVGGAVAHNPIGLIIPCHRVVGSDGALTGYAAGIDRKIQLLRLEGTDEF